MSKLIEALIALITLIYRNKKTRDIPSPRDLIPNSHIKYYPQTKTIGITGIEPKVWITGIQDTNSMDGLMDIGHTVLLINSFDKSQLAVGDIIVYNSPQGYIIHRIIQITEDEQGHLYTCKGDNNAVRDPHLIRNEHIGWLCIGVIF